MYATNNTIDIYNIVASKLRRSTCPRSRIMNLVADTLGIDRVHYFDDSLIDAVARIRAVVLDPTLSRPADDFVAALNGFGRTPPRIARYERQLAKIGARIANGCPRVGDDDRISRIDRKLDKLCNELSRWDAAICVQARVWGAERVAHHRFGARAQISRSPSTLSCRGAARSHRSRHRRRRRCSASRARPSGDADGEPPSRRSPTAIGGTSW